MDSSPNGLPRVESNQDSHGVAIWDFDDERVQPGLVPKQAFESFCRTSGPDYLIRLKTGGYTGYTHG